MEQAILDDRNYEPKKEDFIDKIPETIPEGTFHFQYYDNHLMKLMHFPQSKNVG